jgi:hypothetical protein
VSVDHTIDRNIKDIGLGPYREVDYYGAYDVNGIDFIQKLMVREKQ